MTPTAAASVGARRRRPSPPTDGSHGRAVSKNLGRCAPAGCSATSGRSPETPGSLPSTPGPEGERQWSAASATLRSAPRPHRLRRASMARRSTAACSVCSRHSVQPRQALCDGLQGRRGPPWARWPSSVPTSSMPVGSPISSPAAGPHGALLDGSLLSMLLAFCTASPGSLRRPAGPARTASGAMALLSTYLFDACRLSNLVAGGRPAWRAARWQPAQYALDSDFCLAALTAAASGAGASRLASPVLSTPATRVSARRPRRPRRARMARRSSGACPAGCAGQSASLRAPPPLRGAATGAAAVNTAAVYVTIASLRRRSRRRRSPLAAALPCPAQPSHKQTNTHADSLILVPLSRAGGA